MSSFLLGVGGLDGGSLGVHGESWLGEIKAYRLLVASDKRAARYQNTFRTA